MTTFLVEAYVPESTELAAVETRVRAAAAALAQEGVEVVYVHSILVPGDATCFHLVEAPSQDVVVEVTRRASMPFTRIVEALSPSVEGGSR